MTSNNRTKNFWKLRTPEILIVLKSVDRSITPQAPARTEVSFIDQIIISVYLFCIAVFLTAVHHGESPC